MPVVQCEGAGADPVDLFSVGISLGTDQRRATHAVITDRAHRQGVRDRCDLRGVAMLAHAHSRPAALPYSNSAPASRLFGTAADKRTCAADARLNGSQQEARISGGPACQAADVPVKLQRRQQKGLEDTEGREQRARALLRGTFPIARSECRPGCLLCRVLY